MKKINIKGGDKYGRLTIVEEIEQYITKSGAGRRRFACKCKCGNKHAALLEHLRNGSTTSCGCYRDELNARRMTTHGKSGTIEYRAWHNMKTRCYNKNTKDYQYWGAKGITVCKRWLHSFEAFSKDMGKKPAGKDSIDRINNKRGYSKKNCRWATYVQQNNNRSNCI